MSEPVPSIDVLSDFDLFFYYGQNDLEIETRHDLMLIVMQPKRSLLGSRSVGAAGIQDYENNPIGMNIMINLPYDIVSAISQRNQYVSNGENGSKDRRVALSQSTVRIEVNQGDVDVTVQYIPLTNFQETSVTIPLGIGV
jgi:hypothetical protein